MKKLNQITNYTQNFQVFINNCVHRSNLLLFKKTTKFSPISITKPRSGTIDEWIKINFGSLNLMITGVGHFSHYAWGFFDKINSKNASEFLNHYNMITIFILEYQNRKWSWI